MSGYQWNAKDYEEHSQTQKIWAGELIKKLHLLGRESVLDIGCGDGKVTAEMARLVPGGNVVGIDYSASMIELARKRYPQHTFSNLAFKIMDARQLKFNNDFDVVFSNAVLHWVLDHKPVLAGVYDSLKSGGRLLLQMGGKGNAVDILSVLNELISSTPWRSYFSGLKFPYRFHDVAEYTDLLNSTGFKIKRVELLPKTMIHENQTGLEGWIRTTWLPYTEKVPGNKRGEFIKTFSSRYIARHPKDRYGKIHVAMVRLEVEASKN